MCQYANICAGSVCCSAPLSLLITTSLACVCVCLLVRVAVCAFMFISLVLQRERQVPRVHTHTHTNGPWHNFLRDTATITHNSIINIFTYCLSWPSPPLNEAHTHTHTYNSKTHTHKHFDLNQFKLQSHHIERHTDNPSRPS